MNPDTPEPPAPPRRMTRTVGLIVSFAIAAAAVGGDYLYANHRTGDAQPKAAAAVTTASKPTTAGVREPTSAPATSPAAPASPIRTPGRTCSDSASWDQAGGTTLIDAYIDNQDSGNIDVEDLKATCPQYLPTWQRAQGGFSTGTFAVPADVKPGVYETTSSEVERCYWERSRQGQIVANNFITASKVKQRVTIRSTDDTFITRDCGGWVKVG